MTGFVASLTPEQRKAALAYRGNDNYSGAEPRDLRCRWCRSGRGPNIDPAQECDPRHYR
jgi:hypothetical protein